MIEKLTEAQEAKFPEYTEKWLDIGLATGPADIEKATEAVKLIYESAGLPHPTKFYSAKSPFDAIDIITKLDNTKTPYDVYSEMMYGNQDAAWLSFYDYMYNEVLVDQKNLVAGLTELSKHCGWLNVYEDVVVFQDRPEYIKMDENNVLHSETGPSIRYSDGSSVYSWHGTRIPAEWIEDTDKLTAKIALGWDNVEQRRCACEIVGWDTILSNLNEEVIDTDGDPSIGTLVEVDSVSGEGRDRFLKVICGTGRRFALPVPPYMKTALEAQCWGYDVDTKDILGIEVRT